MDSITSRYYQCGYLYYKTKVPLQSSQLTLVHSDAFIQFIHSLSSLSLSELLVDVNIEFYLFYFQVIVQYQQSSGEILIDENSTKCFYNHYLHIYDVLDTSSLSSIIHYLYCLYDYLSSCSTFELHAQQLFSFLFLHECLYFYHCWSCSCSSTLSFASSGYSKSQIIQSIQLYRWKLVEVCLYLKRLACSFYWRRKSICHGKRIVLQSFKFIWRIVSLLVMMR